MGKEKENEESEGVQKVLEERLNTRNVIKFDVIGQLIALSNFSKSIGWRGGRSCAGATSSLISVEETSIVNSFHFSQNF